MLAAGAGARRAVTSMQDMALAKAQAQSGEGADGAGEAPATGGRGHVEQPQVPRLGLGASQGTHDAAPQGGAAVERQARYQAHRDAALAKLYGPHGPPRAMAGGGVVGAGAGGGQWHANAPPHGHKAGPPLQASASLPHLRAEATHVQHAAHLHGASGGHNRVAARTAFVEGGGSASTKVSANQVTAAPAATLQLFDRAVRHRCNCEPVCVCACAGDAGAVEPSERAGASKRHGQRGRARTEWASDATARPALHAILRSRGRVARAPRPRALGPLCVTAAHARGTSRSQL